MNTEKKPSSFDKAIKIYKYLLVVFTVFFWAYMVYDDWVLVKKYWKSSWPNTLVIWFYFYSGYTTMLSILYWITAAIVIFIHKKWPKRKTNQDEKILERPE